MRRGKLPGGWKWCSLNDPQVCVLNPKKSEVRNLPDSLNITFVPMSAVDDISGTISAPEARKLGQVRKGYTYFAEGDVVFAKITPCMENGKSAIARNLINGIGFGTTEFHVLRPGPMVTAEWIHAFVRRADFRDAARESMWGGAGQQRVPVEFIAQSSMPVPLIDEQHRIVARIEELTSRIEKARSLTLQAVEEISCLFRAGLKKFFSPENTEDWPPYKTSQLFSAVTGQVDPKEKPYADMPHIGPDSIESGTAHLLVNTIRTPRELGLKSGKYLFSQEHVLYSKIRPALQKVCLPNFTGVCSADMYPLLPNEEIISREFLALSLVSDAFTKYAVDNSDRNAMPKINRTALFSFEMRVPDKAIQAQIVRELFGLQAKAREFIECKREAVAELASFTPALLAKAFRGEL